MDSKEAMKEACKQVGVEEIAKSIGLSPTALYNQMNDQDRSDILYKFIDFTNACESDIPIRWACEELNGIFLENPSVKVDHQNLIEDCVPRSLKEFSEVMKEISSAMRDGKVSKKEASRIRKEWEDLKILMESFLLGCELGYYEKSES